MKLSCFFIKQFLVVFIGIFSVLVFIFATSDLFMRSSTIVTLAMVPSLFITMLPIMAAFALPLAAGLAVALPLANMQSNDELLFIVFVRRARWALYGVVLLFSVVLALIYGGLVFWWAPQSHLLGKQMLIDCAYDQFAQLEPCKFHSPLPGLTIYFKEKSFTPGNRAFAYRTLFLAYLKEGNRYFFTARDGRMVDGVMYLSAGAVHALEKQQHHVVQFDETSINIKRLLGDDKLSTLAAKLKFLSWDQLYALKKTESDAVFEIHKRIAQILWQFLLPLFALLGGMLGTRRKSNLLLTTLLVSGIYLFSYVSPIVAYGICCLPPLYGYPTAILFYVMPVVVFLIFLGIAQRGVKK